MDYSQNSLYFFRKLLRKLGLNKILHPLMYGKGYEKKVEDAIFSLIKNGSIVWDIGANIGLYTDIFAKKVSPSGAVLAFEPHPETFKELDKAISNENVVKYNIGFSSAAGSLNFSNRSDSAINTILDSQSDELSTIVTIDTIDNFIVDNEVEVPNFIKIDVEGFELDILAGANKTLNSVNLKTIIVEVHHTLLDARGIKNGAKEISKLLRSKGYSIEWLDPSHLLAKKE